MDENLIEARLERQYNQTAIFPFERNFQPLSARKWARDNFPIVMTIPGIYLIAVYSGRLCMKNRKSFSLKTGLVIWNVFLAAFSVLAFTRTIFEFWHALYNNGLYYSVCDNTLFYMPEISSWILIFAISKIPELFDTFFIVARKRPLTILHWYHHALTMIYTWYAFAYFIAFSRWALVINSFIHSLMYTYYALHAAGYRVPKFVSILITSLQIAQMCIGCWLGVTVFRFIMGGLPCDVTSTSLYLHTIVYYSYLILFSNFFYTTYIKSKPKASNKANTKVFEKNE